MTTSEVFRMYMRSVIRGYLDRTTFKPLSHFKGACIYEARHDHVYDEEPLFWNSLLSLVVDKKIEVKVENNKVVYRTLS